MLSRVAENLYWMARYIERAEDTARLLSVNSHLMLDLPRNVPLGWGPLVEMTGSLEAYQQRYERFDERSVVHFLCAEATNSSSILASLASARENLRTTRDVVPRETWEEVNQLYFYIADNAESSVNPRQRDRFLQHVIRSCQTLTGLIEGTMSQGSARTFIELGRQLERADMTTRIVDVRSASLLPKHPDELMPFENLQWMSVLKSLTAYQMYRQQIRLRVSGPDVLRFLFQDPCLPRSIAYSLETLGEQLQSLPRCDRALATVLMVRADGNEADVQSLAYAPSELHAFIDILQIGFANIHSAIAATYFVNNDSVPKVDPHHEERNTDDDVA